MTQQEMSPIEPKELETSKVYMDAAFSFLVKSLQVNKDRHGCVKKAGKTLRKAGRIFSRLADSLYSDGPKSKNTPEASTEPTVRLDKDQVTNLVASNEPGSQPSSSVSKNNSNTTFACLLVKLFIYQFRCLPESKENLLERWKAVRSLGRPVIPTCRLLPTL